MFKDNDENENVSFSKCSQPFVHLVQEIND